MTLLKTTATALLMTVTSFASAQASFTDPFEDLFAPVKAFYESPEGQDMQESMRRVAQSFGVYPAEGAFAPVTPVSAPAVSSALTPPQPVDPVALDLMPTAKLHAGSILTPTGRIFYLNRSCGPLTFIHLPL